MLVTKPFKTKYFATKYEMTVCDFTTSGSDLQINNKKVALSYRNVAR